jgi:hypothetical protein
MGRVKRAYDFPNRSHEKVGNYIRGAPKKAASGLGKVLLVAGVSAVLGAGAYNVVSNRALDVHPAKSFLGNLFYPVLDSDPTNLEDGKMAVSIHNVCKYLDRNGYKDNILKAGYIGGGLMTLLGAGLSKGRKK